MTNDELLKHYQNSDNQNIIWNVLHKFKFDRDTKYQCGLIGLWKALQKYKKGRGKFTTFLHLCVLWECLAEVSKKPEGKYEEKIASPPVSLCEYLPSSLSKIDRDIVMKLLSGYKLTEIARDYSCSRQNISQKKKRIFEKIRVVNEECGV